MNSLEFKTTVNVFESPKELSNEDQMLFEKAREAASFSYSPYSRFPVGAAMLLSSGKIILGSNQENASFPAGICAERVALSNLAMQAPEEKIKTLAILIDADPPAAPCGICRQSLHQQEHLQQQNIRILLKGKADAVYELNSVKSLLPLPFTF